MNTAVRLAVLGVGAALIALLLGRITTPRPELAAASTSAVAGRAERAAEAAPQAASDARAAGIPASTTEPRAVPADAVEFILGPQVPLSQFFAVLSEVFFAEPGLLRDEYPRVYDLLARFYRQDPAGYSG